jgi:hypothetical protein
MNIELTYNTDTVFVSILISLPFGQIAQMFNAIELRPRAAIERIE